jgi:hypothetical protein
MQLKKAIPINGTLLDYFLDESGFNALVLSKSSSQLVTFDPNTFVKLGSFWINHQLQTPSCIDENCFYVVTNTGQLIAIDKFSGIELVHFDVGVMNVIDFCQTVDGIYSLCGIPINNGGKPTTDLFCVCYNDKRDGKKTKQSPSVRGETVNQMVLVDDIWINIGRKVYKINTQCEIDGILELKVTSNYSPVISNKYISYASNMGTMEVINKESAIMFRKILVEKNSSPPVQLYDDKIIWFAGKSIYVVDIDSGSIDDRKSIPNPGASSVTKSGDSVYVSDDSGNLIQYDFNKQGLSILNLSKNQLWKPIVRDNWVYIASASHLYQVQI